MTPGATDVYSWAQEGFEDARDAWQEVIDELEAEDEEWN